MTTGNKRVGVDVGGSHITATLIDTGNPGGIPGRANRVHINSLDTAGNIITALSNCIGKIVEDAAGVSAVGVAFPGPFDYDKGVSAVRNVGGKFEKTFGLHVQQVLKDFTGLHHIPFRFSNDAHCFAEGACFLQQLRSKRTMFITLGTGFGSAFMVDGSLVTWHPDLPASGALYDQPFLDGIADDFFSTRWILSRYADITGVPATSVKDIVEKGTATPVMQEFGANLGSFLAPWLEKFNCDELVIGGNIARAFSLFAPGLKTGLKHLANKINIMNSKDTEECIVAGAAILAGTGKLSPDNEAWRNSSQELLPVAGETDDTGTYNIYPSFASGEKINIGFESLADEICDENIVVIDGFGGVLWEPFREQLHHALSSKNKKIFWYDISTCLKPAGEIRDMIATSLNGDDPVFGKKYTGTLEDFFDKEKIQLLSPDSFADTCIIYGTGAALTGFGGKVLYVDVPKNEIQFRMRAGSITNLGEDKMEESSQMYKRFYFVDWPVLNQHKENLLPQIDIIVDEQRRNEITWMKGGAFRNTLNKMLQTPFRARPWFEPGVWGGDWMKKNIPQLNQDEINYAWSFELITPENGIVIEGDKNLLEVSFDFLLYAGTEKILGKAARRFGTEFPIRFDFLDTFNGGNLSVQCHPRTAYAKEHFGENFTQDETYYILDCQPDASVYLGFQDSINPVEFEQVLINAQDNGIEPKIENYVQKLPAQKHDLFLIPNGTIHGSGINNLVLEISSTPYIFTFKMYDWMRPGLNGQPRPINIEHGMNNLYFERKGNYVREKLVSHPVIEEEWPEGKKIQLPTHDEHFYNVHRYEFTGAVQINTNNQCHICMLVEGQSVTVNTNRSHSTFHYAETFIIPAAVGSYELKSKGTEKVFVVVAQVKDEHC